MTIQDVVKPVFVCDCLQISRLMSHLTAIGSKVVVRLNGPILGKLNQFELIFARDSIYAIARICYRPSVRPSVRLSHGWISQKRLKLGSCNFRHQVAP